jgi:hypothetical protein
VRRDSWWNSRLAKQHVIYDISEESLAELDLGLWKQLDIQHKACPPPWGFRRFYLAEKALSTHLVRSTGELVLTWLFFFALILWFPIDNKLFKNVYLE